MAIGWTWMPTKSYKRVENDLDNLSLKDKSLSHISLNENWGVDGYRPQNGGLEVNCEDRAEEI